MGMQTKIKEYRAKLNMTQEELFAWWQLWLEQAQITNDQDKDEYSHGVFRHEPRVKISSNQHG